MFSKILIANRGEIAVRVIRACKEMGIATVAVYSEADAEALHVSLADESYCVGGALSKDSYLNMNNIISAAKAAGAEALHPGYGFLSENAEFAALCADNNIVFIGPPADVITRMGDKDMAKKTMAKASVPVIPGCSLVTTAEQALIEAKKAGFPLLIKARAGGGGRGIRLVNEESELKKNFDIATAEAKASFNDAFVYMEKYLNPVKHIEVQILADNFGNVLTLGERDCSVQRKNQKLVEESPACIIDESTRAKMSEASVKAAKAVDYRGAGTIEYLYSPSSKEFYFMEMNTRLQVEHPVTEMITGVDLVKWQIRIAAGLPLTVTEADLRKGSCAIECRINAAGTGNNKITMLHVPGGPEVRFDTAVYHGYAIPPFYDSMIGKLIVSAKTRDEAIRKMNAALCELIIDGIETNIESQIDIISLKEFETGEYTTDLLTN